MQADSSVVIAEHVLLLRKLTLLVLVRGCPRPGLPHLLLPERAYHFHRFRFLIGVLIYDEQQNAM